MSSAGLVNNSRLPNLRPSQPHQGWPVPMDGDEKWILDAKGEVLDMHANSSFGAVCDGFMPIMSQAPAPAPGPPGGGLHRYHSAPSAFMQALADDAFSQIPSSLGNSTFDPLFTEGGLTSISEQMDVERTDSGSSMNGFEQFLSPDSDFSRRAAMSALGAVKTQNADTFTSLFPPAKSTELVRQKSVPVAEKRKPKPDITKILEEHQSEDSISGTSEDNSLLSGLKAAMYSQDDLLNNDTVTSMPTSPGTPGGKRQRGFVGENEISSGSELNSKSYRLNNNQSTGLIRHMSLPTSGDVPNMSLNTDDHYVQMRARAKRGCATHPRSIAERVRRTRISERMKKLQDLVPNMEKTTNTADMLDETVEYVKSLQVKVSELQETIAKLKAASATQITSS